MDPIQEVARLARRSFPHDDPASFREGLRETVRALNALIGARRAQSRLAGDRRSPAREPVAESV
jgi:hypothetical protein